MRNFTFLKLRIVVLLGVLLSSLGAMAQNAVPFTPRLPSGSMRIKGDVIYVGNNILNRTPNPNNAFNSGGDNNNQTMEYINVAPTSTPGEIFSSSSASLVWPTTSNCYRVAYAGLYWASIYPFERSTNSGQTFTPGSGATDAQRYNYTDIKIKLPAATNYTNITADQTIFDGYGYYTGGGTALSRSFKDCPVICYKDVTSLVQGLAQPAGEYTVANVRATRGIRSGGCAGGWVLVIVYENGDANTPSKFVSVFDGYSGVGTSNNVTFNVTGFTTLPAPFDVKARFGIGALEGDLNTSGDGLSIKANIANAPETSLSNALNPVNNFFNSSITRDAAYVTTRNPASTNTLGFDLDMFDIPNPPKPNGDKNSVIPNGTTGAALKLTTSGDGYGAFLSTFSVEVIEPKIVLTKTVKNMAGNDIAGAPLDLGESLYYDITYQNKGNDNAQNFTIRDVLPVNTVFEEVVLPLPPGVTYTFPTPGTILFNISNNAQIVKGGGAYTIRIKVRVANDCNEFTDHCSNIIQNSAYGTYRGVENTSQITDDPSVSVIACNAAPGPVNFLADVSLCQYQSTVTLCGPTLTLTAGAGYPGYAWFRKDPGGDVPIGNSQSVIVNIPAEYYVVNTPTPPCIGIEEHFTVVLSSVLPPNPLIAQADETAVCANNGIVMSNIFLCGLNDERLLSAGSVVGTARWYRLNTAACNTALPANCPHNACPESSWTLLETGTSYTANTAGEYRLVIDNSGCQAVYYFNVDKNNLNPQYVIKSRICGSPGEIKVTNVGAGYEYQFRNQSTGAIVQAYSTNDTYTVNADGVYYVEIRQVGVTDGCVFTIGNLGMTNATLDATITVVDKTCSTTDPASITIQPLGLQFVNPNQQYRYTITGPATITSPWINNSNPYTFNNLAPGTYTVTVVNNGTCTLTRTVTINDYSNPQATAVVQQSITCDPGIIRITATGGKAPYSFAAYSKDGVVYNPAEPYFSDGLYEVTAANAGTYVFVVVDANGCIVNSNAVTITAITPTITTAFTNPKCLGENNGTITVTATGSGITYELTDSSGTVTPSTTGSFVNLAPGTYTVDVIQTTPTNVCRIPRTFTLVPATAITAPTPTITAPLTCISNATITVGNASGGTGPYEYSINGTTFGTSQTFTNITAGTYTVTVRDANGCTFQTASVTVNTPPAITAVNVTQTPVTCPAQTSDVTLTATGGTGTFIYTITAPASAAASNTTGVFTGLAPNTYSYLVTNNFGCTRTGSFTVNPITPVSVTGYLMKPVACIGTSTGAIRFNISGIGSTYNYTITSSAGATVITPATVNGANSNPIFFNNVAAGTYTITVTNPVTNCTASASVTVTAPTAALAVTTTLVQPTCTVATGTATANVTGGWGSNIYTITGPSPSTTPSAPQSSPTFTNLAAGTYEITVTDLNGNGCIVTSASFTIQADGPPVLTVTGSDLCLPSSFITVEVTAGTGKAPFQFSLNGAAYAAGTAADGTTYNNLPAGTHTITVRDANGCTNTTTVTRTINAQLTASTSLTKGITCTTPTAAQIAVTIGGGQASYTYEVTTDGGTTYAAPVTVTGSFTYTAATAGNYQFRITDAAGCIVTTPVRTVAPLVQPEFTFGTTTDVTCNGANTGALTVTIDTTKGVSPQITNVLNTTTGSSFGTQTSGLPAGTYEVTVTDANGCTVTHTEDIDEPDPIAFNYDKTDISCNNPGGIAYGQIVVGFGGGVTGGVAPYTYTVSNNFGDVLPVQTNMTGAPYTFMIVNYGIYTIEVTDANGCTSTINNIVIASPPNALDIDVSSTVDCVNGGTATVEVGAVIIGSTYKFAILTQSSLPFVANVATDYKDADVGTPTIATFNNLIPGVLYTFVVWDTTTDCYYFEQADYPIPTNSTITTTTVIPNNVTCFGEADGNVGFTFTGYSATTTQIKYEIFRSPSNLTTGITDTIPTTGTSTTVNSIPGDLAPGDYVIVYTEIDGSVAGCSQSSASFEINQSATMLVASAVVTKNDNCDTNAGVITASATFGTAPYSYQLLSDVAPAPTETTWAGQASPVFNAEGGDYIVYVKDANDCIKPFSITLPTDVSPVITAVMTPGIQCSAAEGGFSIDVTQTAGNAGGYTYSLDGGAFETKTAPFIYTDLASGNHTVQVMDANGCTMIAPVSVTVYPPLSVTAQPTVQPACADNDGEIEAEGDGGSGNYTYELAGPVNVAAQPSPQFTGLPHGTYTVTITDTTTLCTEDVAVTLEDAIEILPADITFDQVDVACNGESDGVINVYLAATNTDIPYTYSLNGGTPQTISQFTGLAANTYTIDVTSGKGCTEQITVTIAEPSQLAIDVPGIVVTPFACNPADNTPTVATVTFDAVATTGTAPYKYSINGSVYNDAPDNTFNVTDTGVQQTITLYLMDDHGCVVTETITIDPLPVMAVPTVTQVTAITCTNPEEIILAVTGGSGEYRFELLPDGTQIEEPGAGVSSQNFDLTEPGTYVFRVTDLVTGCEITTAPYVINDFDLIEVEATASTPVDCQGSSTGTITIDVQNYNDAYDYEVLDGTTIVASGSGDVTVANPFTITGVPSGNLTVRVIATGTPFCDAVSAAINVAAPADVLTAIATQTGSVQCTNDQGEITVSATGGWGGYEYQLVNTTTSTTIQAFATNNQFTGLPAGDYELTVRDSSGCDNAVDTVTLAPIAPITANISASATAVACKDDQTVTIEAITVAGGQGTYEYILNTYDAAGTAIESSTGAQLSPIFNNIGAGTYSITVIDGWNCGPFETPTVTITEPDQLIGTLSLTDELSCLTGAELTIEGLGGTAPYEFSTDGGTTWNPSNNAGGTYLVTIPVNGAGTYQYQVRDDNGCEAVLTNEVTIDPVPALDIDLNLDAAEVNCNGVNNAYILALATGGLGNYQYTLVDAANAVVAGPNTTGEFEDLGAGTYYVRVNSGDCELTSPVINITEPDPLVVTFDVDNILCFDGPNSTNGRITVNTTGGTAPMQYAISPNLDQFFNSNIFYPLTVGTYDVLTQDANGCFYLETITITQPDPIEATIDYVQDEACLGAGDGIIEVSLTGGTGTYEISTDDITYVAVTGTSYTLTGLPSGLTTVYVKDQNGCSLNPPMEQPILPGVDMDPEATVTPTCVANAPNNDVTITIIPGVDPANVTYSIDGVNYQSSNVFTNVGLAPGTYVAYARHIVPVTNLTCIQTDNFVIDTYIAISASVTATTDVNCFGDATGEITVTATGGTGTLSYAIADADVLPLAFGTYQATGVFTDLAAGNYAVSIMDDNLGCETQVTATIAEPAAPLAATADSQTNILCFGDATGDATVSVTGGTVPYTYSWDTTPAQTTATATGLTAGTYTVTITDDNGCTTTQSFTITEPAAPLTATADSQTDVLCYGEATGDATVSVTGGTGAYTYSWDTTPVQTTATATGLTAGTYTVTVTDANACTTTQSFTITEPAAPLAATAGAQTDVLCYGNATGSATVNVTGGTTAYTYSWDTTPVQTTATATGLTAGTYTVTVTDANGCTTTQSFTITQPALPLASTGGPQVNVLCYGNATGSATVNVTGGTGAYTYSWNTTPVQTTATATGLAAGTYTVTITDANGCTTTQSFTITQPAAPLAATAGAQTNVLCYGNATGSATVNVTGGTTAYTYSWNTTPVQTTATATGLTAGTYTVTVTDANGCTTTQSFTITQPAAPLSATTGGTQTNVLCFGNATGSATVNVTGGTIPYTYSWNTSPVQTTATATGLTAGTYTVTVTDANGCTTTQSFTITQPAAALAATAGGQTNVLCYGAATGSATVNVTGGTTAYTYSWNTTPVQTTATATGLTAGTYTVTVTDANGCTTTQSFTITQPASAVTATTTHTDEQCLGDNNGSITVMPQGGTAPYTASLNGGAATPVPAAPAGTPIVFNGLGGGNYTIVVTDANGCTVSSTTTVLTGIVINPTVSTTQECDMVTVVVSVDPSVVGQVTYSLDGGAPQASNTFVQQLDPAVPHTVTVVHTQGCSRTTDPFTVAPVVPIVLDPANVNVTNIACHGKDVGSITVNATGGTGPLQYAITWTFWPTPFYGPSNTFNDLLAGTYTIHVKDAMGCVETIDVTITEPADELVIAAAVGQHESCVNAHDGAIDITSITGGTPPYYVALDSPVNFQPYDAAAAPDFAGLYGRALAYDVYVRDANGCYAKVQVTIERGVNLVPGIQTVLSCVNNVPVNTVTATLNANISNVEYRLETAAGALIQDFDPNKTWELAPGSYVYTVRHINGCQKDFAFTVQPRVPITVTSVTPVDATCNGNADGTLTVVATGGTGTLSYGISPDYVMSSNPVFTGLPAGTYTIRVQDQYGCYVDFTNFPAIGEPAAITVTDVMNLPENCVDDNDAAFEIAIAGGNAPYATSLDASGPFVADQTLFDNLDSGTYTVYVQDANGCTATHEVILVSPLDINATAQVVYNCDENTVTIVTNSAVNPGELTYNLVGPKGNNPPQTSNVFANLEDGNYEVEVVNTVSGCTDEVAFTITSVPDLAISVAESGLNQVKATVVGGQGPYQYTFDGNSTGSNNTFTYFASGTYEITVTDSRGCTRVTTITVEFIDIILPDVVTPDGDGQNDTWSPGNTANYPNIKSEIFDRYGRKLATLRQGQSWDTIYDGSPMPTGDYWFLVKLGDEDDRSFVGHFTIYR
ncbi:MAG: hypothetical protein DI539_02865 [Flavobacterium psychrophilum]|nr:MAG: hypothetical protein DI539_02865 [Flavobacterium psychrophilum]